MCLPRLKALLQCFNSIFGLLGCTEGVLAGGLTDFLAASALPSAAIFCISSENDENEIINFYSAEDRYLGYQGYLHLGQTQESED